MTERKDDLGRTTWEATPENINAMFSRWLELLRFPVGNENEDSEFKTFSAVLGTVLSNTSIEIPKGMIERLNHHEKRTALAYYVLAGSDINSKPPQLN